MPANLTPEYEKAEQRYREAASDEERLTALQEMLSKIPKHKGTDRMQGDIKRRISQLRKAMIKKGPVRGVDPFHVPKSGAAQVILTGLPNSGKSALLAASTNAPARVAEYPFTTSLPAPGMYQFEDVQIQLVDTPPMTAEHMPPGLMGAINFADAVAVVIDAADRPVQSARTVLDILAQRGLTLLSRPRNSLDGGDRRQRSALLLANKIDLADSSAIAALRQSLAGTLDVLPVSAATSEGLAELGRRLWHLLALIRIYTKEPGKSVDRDRPYTLPAASTIEDLAREIHRDLPAKMKYARLWGDGRINGQRAHRSQLLQDKDIVEIHQ